MRDGQPETPSKPGFAPVWRRLAWLGVVAGLLAWVWQSRQTAPTLPASSVIAVAMVEATSRHEVRALDLAGGVRTLVAVDGLFPYDPVCSPDRRRLLFGALSLSPRIGGFQLYLAEPGDSSPRPLTALPPGYDAVAPSWSPDGRQVAFTMVSNPEAQRDAQIALIELKDDSRQGPLLLGEGRQPRWSPDGARLAWDRDTADGVGEIVILPLDGKPRTLCEGRSPLWSPDGADLLIVQRTGHTVVSPDDSTVRYPAMGLAVVSADDGRLRYWVSERTDLGVWAPDGQSIAWLETLGRNEGPEWRLWTQRVLSNGVGVATKMAEGRPGWSAWGLSWSADGTTICFTAASEFGLAMPEDPTVWLVDATSGTVSRFGEPGCRYLTDDRGEGYIMAAFARGLQQDLLKWPPQ